MIERYLNNSPKCRDLTDSKCLYGAPNQHGHLIVGSRLYILGERLGNRLSDDFNYLYYWSAGY